MGQRVCVRKVCSESGKPMLACHAEDTTKNRPPSSRERCALAQRSAGATWTTDGEQAPEIEARLSTLFSTAGNLNWGLLYCPLELTTPASWSS